MYSRFFEPIRDPQELLGIVFSKHVAAVETNKVPKVQGLKGPSV